MSKVNDVIEFTLRIEPLIPEEDFEKKTVIDIMDYKHNYDVSYSVNNYEEYGNYNYTLDEGFIPSFMDDMEECVKEEMASAFPEVTDYEIYDVCDSDYGCQTAKVRVKAVKD